MGDSRARRDLAIRDDIRIVICMNMDNIIVERDSQVLGPSQVGLLS